MACWRRSWRSTLGRRQVILPPSSFTLFRPYLGHFYPVFSRVLRVLTVLPRRPQRAKAERDPLFVINQTKDFLSPLQHTHISNVSYETLACAHFSLPWRAKTKRKSFPFSTRNQRPPERALMNTCPFLSFFCFFRWLFSRSPAPFPSRHFVHRPFFRRACGCLKSPPF